MTTPQRGRVSKRERKAPPRRPETQKEGDIRRYVGRIEACKGSVEVFLQKVEESATEENVEALRREGEKLKRFKADMKSFLKGNKSSEAGLDNVEATLSGLSLQAGDVAGGDLEDRMEGLSVEKDEENGDGNREWQTEEESP